MPISRTQLGRLCQDFLHCLGPIVGHSPHDIDNTAENVKGTLSHCNIVSIPAINRARLAYLAP
jgi:hypothetical protein